MAFGGPTADIALPSALAIQRAGGTNQLPVSPDQHL